MHAKLFDIRRLPTGDPLAFAQRVPDTRNMISNDPRPPWTPRASHPADSSTLPLYMVLFFLLGLVGFVTYGLSDGDGAFVLASIVSGVFFTCFLILFTIYWVGYLLKGHAIWQSEREAAPGGPLPGRQPEG